jgi:SRSO17 transposase
MRGMTQPKDGDGATAGAEQRSSADLDAIARVLGHADRVAPLRAYCTGLLLPGARKSVEPMAAKLAPQRVQAAHQSLHHLVAKAAWSDAAVLATVRAYALPAILRHGPIRTWIVDDTAFPKQGKHSVGVARQYCGQLGKPDNCQVAVTLSVASDHASLPLAYRPYLPEAWASDPARRAKAGVPAEIGFATKPAIALAQIRAAVAQGVPAGVVLADAAYGKDGGFRDGVSALGLIYALGIPAVTTVWPPGAGPLPPKPWRGTGRRPKRLRRDPDHQPVPAEDLARSLPTAAWRTVAWREGSRSGGGGGGARLSSRFGAVRVRPAHRDYWRAEPHPEEWLLIEWPQGEPGPTKYWLSTLPGDARLADLVAAAKGRWRIERDYQELKQEVGLGHYEGRGWRGFHHHATLCIAAYGFLIAERCRFPPGERFGRHDLAAPAPPAGLRPRGAGAPRAA